MLLDYILDRYWLAIGIWIVLYCLDYLFTLKAARMYQEGAHNHMVFGGGYELNPVFQDDIAALRRVSPRFFLLLIACSIILFMIYVLAFGGLFEFSLGLLIGVQLTVHMRHIRNLAIFTYAKRSQGMTGKLQYEHWLSLRLSAIELFTYAGLFLFLLIVCPRMFLAGCAVSCFTTGWRHLMDSKRRPAATPEAAA
jgi:hypothetical protein